MQYSELLIEYSDPNNVLDPITLRFKLNKFPIVEKWISKVIESKELYSIDDPDRFYGFNKFEQEIENAVSTINSHIDTINNYQHIITRKVTSNIDQDTLNYLHHIFEVYHGMLDKQDHDFWNNASEDVHHALAQLNIEVHRCESLVEGFRKVLPRHVVTWFGLPKRESLELNDYEHFTDFYKFGTVYLNYVEIGKTLEDLSIDNDKYISDEAFKPFYYYSSDFVVKYYGSSTDSWKEGRIRMNKYYKEHAEFFRDRNLPLSHPYCKPGLIPLAELMPCPFDVVDEIRKRQYVSDVYFK
jgi:hypothetical protein